MTKFVNLKKGIWVNPDHVRSIHRIDDKRSTLILDDGATIEVPDSCQTVATQLTDARIARERFPE